MPNKPTSFIWYELMTSDTEAAKAFYGAVVGWGTQPFDSGYGAYTILTANGRGMGGLLEIPAEARAAGARPVWLGYIAVDDVDASVAAVTAEGGRLHKEIMDVPAVGRIALIVDPQGAPVHLIAPTGEDQPPVDPMTPGHVGWHELHTSDRESAFDFYSRHFGWAKADAMDMGAMGVYQIFTAGDGWTGGMMNDPDFPRPLWLFYFVVEDVDAAAERVGAAGGKVLNGPSEVPGGAWIIQCRDPQGAMFALVGMRGGAAKGEKE